MSRNCLLMMYLRMLITSGILNRTYDFHVVDNDDDIKEKDDYTFMCIICFRYPCNRNATLLFRE